MNLKEALWNQHLCTQNFDDDSAAFETWKKTKSFLSCCSQILSDTCCCCCRCCWRCSNSKKLKQNEISSWREMINIRKTILFFSKLDLTNFVVQYYVSVCVCVVISIPNKHMKWWVYTWKKLTEWLFGMDLKTPSLRFTHTHINTHAHKSNYVLATQNACEWMCVWDNKPVCVRERVCVGETCTLMFSLALSLSLSPHTHTHIRFTITCKLERKAIVLQRETEKKKKCVCVCVCVCVCESKYSCMHCIASELV